MIFWTSNMWYNLWCQLASQSQCNGVAVVEGISQSMHKEFPWFNHVCFKKWNLLPRMLRKLSHMERMQAELQAWIKMERCWHEVQAEYFQDGLACPCKMIVESTNSHMLLISPHPGPVGICCNNCLPKPDPCHILLCTQIAPPQCADPSSSSTEDSPGTSCNVHGKHGMVKVATIANHHEAHCEGAQELLVNWCNKTWLELYWKQLWPVHVLLPDILCFKSLVKDSKTSDWGWLESYPCTSTWWWSCWDEFLCWQKWSR